MEGSPVTAYKRELIERLSFLLGCTDYHKSLLVKIWRDSPNYELLEVVKRKEGSLLKKPF